MTETVAPVTALLRGASQRPTTHDAQRRLAGRRGRVPCLSFEDGYAWLLPFAYKVGYRFRGGDRSFAEDVAQETLTRAYVAWPRVRRHPNPEAWITLTALHVALELDRRQRRAGRPTSIPVTNQSSDEQRVVDAHHLAKAMQRLSKRQQQVIVWRYYFDQSIRQTAQRLGLSEAKVKDATHEALTKLGRIMGADGSVAASVTNQPREPAGCSDMLASRSA